MWKKELKLYNFSIKFSMLATALWSGVMAVLLSDIIASYSLSGTQEGLMSSMISIGALIALLANIAFQSRFKKPQIIIWCGFLASAMLIVDGLPLPFTMFLLTCFFMGFGHGAADVCQSAFTADLNPKDTAKHIGALHGVFGLGGILTPIFLHELLKYYNWRSIYIIAGLICFVIIAQFAVVTHYLRNKIDVASRVEPKLTTEGMRDFFGNSHCIFILFCIFFAAAAQSGIIVWTIRYVSVSLNSPDIAAVCLSVFWVTSTISRFCSPRLPFRPGQIIAAGSFISAAAWAGALLINLPLAICVACVITGLASGSGIPLSLSEGTAANPGKTGFAASILMLFKTCAQVLTPIVVAFVMSVGGMRAGMYVTSALFVFNGVFALLVLLRRVEIH